MALFMDIANASYAVSSSFRGKGIGRKLVEHSLETAAALGFRILQFNAVVATNTAARKLYMLCRQKTCQARHAG